MKQKILSIVLICPFSLCLAQQKQLDSVKSNALNEVVVTGQFEPQSVKKSVFNVRLITSKDIQNLAANNLSDVLNQYLNTTVRPSGADGRSTVSLFGLDSQYFKILVDNVPLVNEAGLGNNTDLSQINLNDIEQIEIVEGSMGVTHGANAVSGILNIITKKSSVQKWSISATSQEETVKNEFSFFDRGRHIQSLKVSHSLADNWFVSIGGNRNDFQGFLDDKKGKYHKENDQARGYRWLPKEQINASALISYQKKQFRAFYKFEYLDETTDFYNSTVQSGFSDQFGGYRYADDKRYLVNRFFHNLNVAGKLFSKINYTASLSHQKQERNVEDFRYNLSSRKETMNVTAKDQSMEVLYSTGTLSNFFSDKSVDLQLGYETVHNRGFSVVQEANNTWTAVAETLENYDFFASSEIKATERLSIRPGLRFSVQSKFKEQYASSLGLRYLFDKGLELRGSYGNSFRTPTFEELYYKMVFDSHYFVGNPNLVPETSTSYEISLKKATALSSGLQISNTFSGSFLNVDDKIQSALIAVNPSKYQYININKYNVWNFSSTNQFKKENWSFNLGAALIGISQKINNQEFTSSEKYLYSFTINSSVSYAISKWDAVVSAYYKYNGKSQQFVQGDGAYVISDIEASNWLDASVRKNFFKGKLETTLGARNLLNVTSINQTRTNEGAGHATSSQIMLAYGRSYFLKLTYNLNF
ncbi:TonB-dependent receptor plug domain-containing protein [Flavobacterium humi]|uniref:TonB-dependent receptor n=1 Tax=Flavobacterium humi TaxID=2562683 RepID=A0A4Z0L6R7_9FLAO|nr:TonB-dependent receptor [Flavobacterium humi]TGD57941.1 TonB-dependent receptor [Flavobacterium humi]